ncbi:MAG: SsrA-binding protein [Deltaproteobacteria bacterium RBG_13_43_22]|nr:MAG: SsrA-binding protein [Deltaproteobacteria bacterium RBG_13_43_22]
MPEHIKIISQNRKAHHDYQIQETIEAGLILTGPEVKSLRLGRANLKDSYARPKGGEVFLYEVHISPYENSPLNEQDPTRTRKLLLHKQEIRRLTAKIREKGLTLVPLRLYFLGGKAKVELALAKGKKLYDKREAIQKKDMKRETDRQERGKK